MFKRIFGHAGNEDITKSLISSIIQKEISEIKLDCNPILEKDVLDDKIGILDIKAKLDNNINCNIEMQIVDKKNIEKRILFYWGKMYNSSIKTGQNYSNLEKTIVILISDYELESIKEIKKYITKWNIREEDYRQIILTDVMEFYIIELPKFEKYKEAMPNKELNLWTKFIKNPEVISMDETNKLVKKAKQVLEEISNDERERYLAELREKYILDQKAIEGAGYDKGLKAGLERGIEQGKMENTLKIAQKMKEQKIDIEIISTVTGLTKDEIENLN